MNRLEKIALKGAIFISLCYASYKAGVYYSTKFLLEHENKSKKMARKIQRDVNTPKEYLLLYFAKKAAQDYLKEH